MRKWLTSAATVFALSFGGIPAFAQQVTPATVQEAVRLGSMHQAAYMRLLGIFETMPTYPEEKSGVDSGQWLAQSRNWIGASRAVIAEVRMSMAAMPSVPSGLPDRIRQALTLQARRFPEIVSGVEQFVSRFSGELNAIERGDEGGAQKMAVSAMDAASFTVGIMRDINVAQANFVGENHPQTYFLRSVARSYDGMLAVVALGRANLVGETVDRASAARTVTEAASDMRQNVEAGRREATASMAVMAAASQPSPEGRAFQQRVLAAFGTYSGSFDRELEAAAVLDSLAVLLRDRRSYEEIVPELDALHLRLATLDSERAADMQRRMAMMQGQ